MQRLPNGAITTGDLMLNGKATARKRQKQRGEAIVVRVRVKANEYLIVKASGTIDLGATYKLRARPLYIEEKRTKTLKLSPKKVAAKRIARALKRGERAKARVTVRLADLVGNRETEKLRVRLKQV